VVPVRSLPLHVAVAGYSRNASRSYLEIIVHVQGKYVHRGYQRVAARTRTQGDRSYELERCLFMRMFNTYICEYTFIHV
jgi:hypothetical protein